MKFFLAIFALVFFFKPIYADVERDLQQRINEINIALNSKKLSRMQKTYLLGVSKGLFMSMDIINANEKKTPPTHCVKGDKREVMRNSPHSLCNIF